MGKGQNQLILDYEAISTLEVRVLKVWQTKF
jgi:hypothetical protein